jgi:gliding motility-associated-like protein
VAETVAATTTYNYVATGTTGACSDADTVRLTVRALPSVATLPKSVNICRYDSARLSVGGAATYAWSPITGLANPTGSATMAKPDSMTLYTVTGTDIYGCVNRDTVRVMVNDALPVKASGDGQPISCDNSLAQLHVTGATTYVWSPGQYLNDSTMAHPVATPPATMLFTVIGSNSAGCTGRDTITVVSVKESTLMMPNAFTPNGDGINDRVYPLVYCDFTFRSFSIYNRWGQRVFHGTKLEQGWDGHLNGEPAEVGVYPFYLEGVGADGQTKFLKGNLTLLR